MTGVTPSLEIAILSGRDFIGQLGNSNAVKLRMWKEKNFELKLEKGV